MQCCTAEQIVEVPVPRVMEELLEVAKHVPQERVPNYTVEQLVDVTAPWIRWTCDSRVLRKTEFPVLSVSKSSTFSSLEPGTTTSRS